MCRKPGVSRGEGDVVKRPGEGEGRGEEEGGDRRRRWEEEEEGGDSRAAALQTQREDHGGWPQV